MAELASQPTSIQSIYAWYAENKIFVNRRYQRKLVWTLIEKQRLIESILRKYPIPAILIAEREQSVGTYEIIDGLQRLHAIVSFVETTYPTLDGKYFNLKFFPTAKERADAGEFEEADSPIRLTQKEISTILDYNLAVSVMRNASEAEVNDVFGRINTYGHRLSDQERRQAGVQNEFAEMVRELSCTLRGDASSDVLPLKLMPSISIDLPKTKHGYEIQAEDVFWVSQGILRSTDLRDSMDEQCVADIAACVVRGELIERSKDTLDEIYSTESAASAQLSAALDVYGRSRFVDEFKFCVDEILKICAAGSSEKLRDIIFSKRTTNAFPSVFAVLVLALHEIIVKEKKSISSYVGCKKSFRNIADRIETGRRATSIEERRKNIDSVKGIISPNFVAKDVSASIYNNHTTTDIEALIRRSEIEVANYELKQGILTLSEDRKINSDIFRKIVCTICAIANNGRGGNGKILIGVCDRAEHASKISKLDGVDAKKIGKRYVVGVAREARVLALSLEAYFAKVKQAIQKSDLSPALRDGVLSGMDFNSFYGLGVIIITIPEQRELSYVGEDVYWRNGDSTEIATAPKQIAALAKRF
jgi:hypothetical protein